MADSLANKDTSWLARFVQDVVAQATPTQVAFQGADQLTVSTLLQVLDQIELSKQAMDYIGQGYDSWHLIGAAGSPSFTNGWQHYDLTGAWRQARYRKFPGGWVRVEGLVKLGTLDSAIFTLPAGYRPGQNLIFSGVDGNNVPRRLDVSSSGVINTSGAVSNAFQSLSQIWFLAEL